MTRLWIALAACSLLSCSQDADGQVVTEGETDQSVADVPVTEAGRIWKGTLGDLPVTACFEEEHIRDGIYYYDKHLIPLRLVEMAEQPEDPLILTEVEGFDDLSGATWTIDSKSDTRLSATWRKGNRTLPIRMEAVEVEVSQYASACESAEFLEPILAGGTTNETRELFEGLSYTQRTYVGPDRLGGDEYVITSFALDPVQPGDAAINRLLAKVLPRGSADDAMGQCVGLSLFTGQTGYMSEAQRPVFVSDEWLGVERSGSGYCGGAHPGHFWSVGVYNRTTGEEVDPSTWFKPDALKFYEFEHDDPKPTTRPIAGLSAGLNRRVQANWPSDGGDESCEDLAGTDASWVLGLAQGGVVFVPQFPHVIFACTTDVVVPWDELAPYLSDEGRAVRKALER